MASSAETSSVGPVPRSRCHLAGEMGTRGQVIALTEAATAHTAVVCRRWLTA